MKRCFIVFCLLAVMNAVAFAHIQFSFDGHLATNFSSTAPTIGVGFNSNEFEVLLNANFWVYTSERTDKDYQTFNTDNTLKESRFEFKVGFAPKAAISEKLYLSFPLMGKVSFRGDLLEYDNSDTYDTYSAKSVDYFGYGFSVGARTYYVLNQKFDLYAGILFDAVSINNNKYIYWKSSPTSTYTRKYENVTWFENGELGLGLRFKF